jgi:hypothetical protein
MAARLPHTRRGIDRTRHLVFCSQLVRRRPGELAARSSFRCIFGTVVLGLSRMRFSSSETELEIYNLFGTVTVIVPDGVQISVSGGGLFESQHIDGLARSSIASVPRLRINARGPGGTLYVRNPGPIQPLPPRAQRPRR